VPSLIPKTSGQLGRLKHGSPISLSTRAASRLLFVPNAQVAGRQLQLASRS